ncbi:MAG: amino acid-binding protein [Planctomycetia bacterium]|nr:amino acid-binding protein [Planctomycetia bacterium]
MKLHQLSLFLENRPGHLLNACRTLANAGINVETMALSDTEQFGILRILVKEWERAKKVFEDKGIWVKVTEVIAAKTPNRPGGLADLLEQVAKIGLNVEYMYGFDSMVLNSALLVLRFDDPDKALRLLTENGVEIVGESELFQNK